MMEVIVTTNKGTKHNSKIIAIAGGLGSFEPRKPVLENLKNMKIMELTTLLKILKNYKDKSVVIAGGGDSALDWTIFLATFVNL